MLLVLLQLEVDELALLDLAVVQNLAAVALHEAIFEVAFENVGTCNSRIDESPESIGHEFSELKSTLLDRLNIAALRAEAWAQERAAGPGCRLGPLLHLYCLAVEKIIYFVQ